MRVMVERGLRRPGDPRVWGTIIGAVGASVFVNANRGQLSERASLGALVLWLGALAVFIWAVFLAERQFPEPAPLPRGSGWVYLLSVAGMIAVIQVGRVLLTEAGEAEVLPGVIVLAVGLHFLPFARAFRTPMFTRLGLVMIVLGTAALALGLVWSPTATAALVVLSGLVMLVVIAEDATRDRASRTAAHSHSAPS